MDPVKVVIFLGAFLVLLFLGRKLSSNSESILVPAPIGTDGPVEEDEKPARQPAVIGAELPFPISLPDLIRDPDGRYNRPEFHNYYFEKTDLLSGPDDPATFYDHFFIEARDVENDHRIIYKYFVATPLGLQKALANNHLPALHLKEHAFKGHAFIVARWDLPLILETVVASHHRILCGRVRPRSKCFSRPRFLVIKSRRIMRRLFNATRGLNANHLHQLSYGIGALLQRCLLFRCQLDFNDLLQTVGAELARDTHKEPFDAVLAF